MNIKNSNFAKPILLVISTLTIMSGATIAPSLPAMANVFSDVPNAPFLAKLVLTLPALAIAIMAPIAGRLVDQIGRLKVLFPALLLYALAGSFGFFIHNLYLILIGRFFLGIAVGCIMTVAITLIGDYYQGAERSKFIGFQAAFMSLGGAVFVGLGGYLADLHWSYPFLIYLFALLVLAASYFVLFEPTRALSNTEDGRAEKPKIIMVLPVLLVALLSMVIFYMLPVQIPFALQDIEVNKSSSAGLAIATATLAATAVGFTFGFLRSKLSMNRIFVLLFSFMALGFWAVSQSQLFYQVIISMVIIGCGMGLLMPNINTWLLSKSTNQNRGTYSGWLSASLFLGQFLSPIILLPVVEANGVSYAFFVGALGLMVGAIIFFLMNRLEGKKEGSHTTN